MILCNKIIFNKIKQGLIYILGDLVIERHVRLLIPGMIMSSGEFIMSCRSWCPIEMPENMSLHRVNWGNWVAVAWEPMSDKGNGLGWCKGIKVKNFIKNVMETQSCEYGFILNWISGRNYGSQKATSVIIVLCKVEHVVDNDL